MASNAFQVVAQFTGSAQLSTVRPRYEISGPVANFLDLWLDVLPLATKGHFLVRVTAKVTGLQDAELCFSAQVSAEVVCIAGGELADGEVPAYLRAECAMVALGHARSVLHQLTANSSYGPQVFPPVELSRLEQLSPYPSEESAPAC